MREFESGHAAVSFVNTMAEKWKSSLMHTSGVIVQDGNYMYVHDIV